MFYARIKELRLERELTQLQTACALGFTLSAYRRMECVNLRYTFEVERLAQFYQVPTDYILERTDCREPAGE